MSIKFERITSLVTELGECPIWDEKRQCLWLIDSRAGYIHKIDVETNSLVSSYQVPAPAGSFALNHDGRLLVALKEQLALYDPKNASIEIVAAIEDRHANLRLNDGRALSDGSFFVGTMHTFREEGEPPLGGLYRLLPERKLVKLETGIGVTNGPCISPLDDRLYVCDSSLRQIYSYTISQDALTERLTFVDTECLGSAPDGCCFDMDGGLWTALVHAACIVRFDQSGKLSAKIDLPLTHPSSLCFGGKDLNEIYVTSISNSGRLFADGPLDGAVIKISNSGFKGIPSLYTHIQ